MWKNNYQDCLSYVDSYWDKIIHIPKKDKFHHKIGSFSKVKTRHHPPNDYAFINIPHPYITPNQQKFNYIFYWDTYFISKGLIGTSRDWILLEMVKNFIFLFEKYGLMPNFNSPSGISRSQPPFFTSMLKDTFLLILDGAGEKGKNFQGGQHSSKSILQYWYKKALDTAKKEYYSVWLDESGLFNHRVHDQLLSKYGDMDVGYGFAAEIESGWDFSSRFYNRCHQFLPVDLNSYLYQYETDFATYAALNGQNTESNNWLDKAKQRQKAINDLLWNEQKGFFYDYDWFYRKQSNFLSLAGFTPLWAGLATAKQAAKAIEMLPKFTSEYGLTITAKESIPKMPILDNITPLLKPALNELFKPKQWDYPNDWPPLEYLTTIGLLKYGYITQARQIMEKSVKTHARIFRKFNTFFEKINADTSKPGQSFNYDTQQGFGWTNGIFYRYIQILDILDSGQQIYKQPNPSIPPYELAMLH